MKQSGAVHPGLEHPLDRTLLLDECFWLGDTRVRQRRLQDGQQIAGDSALIVQCEAMYGPIDRRAERLTRVARELQLELPLDPGRPIPEALDVDLRFLRPLVTRCR